MRTVNDKQFEFQWGEQHSMISAECWMNCYGHYLLGQPKKIDYLVIAKNRYLETYASQAMVEEWKNFSRVTLKPPKRQALLKSSQQAQKQYWQFFAKVKRLSLSSLSKRELLQLLQNYLKVYGSVGKHFVLSQPESVDKAVNYLQNKLKEKNAHELMPVLITHTALDIINQEQLELTRFNKNVKNHEALQEHALKHAWLFFNSYDTRENIEFLRQRLGENFNHKKKLAELKKLKSRQEIIFQRLNDEEIKEICLWLQTLAVDRLDLKNCWGGAEFRFLPLFAEIAERSGLPLELMMATYRQRDYENFLLAGKKLGKKHLQQRWQQFAFWKQRNKIVFTHNKNKVERLATLAKKQEAKKDKSAVITGVVASRGKVTGTVRIVPSINIEQVLKDLARFKKGDILVTWMTQPNMVPIAKKAGAIIADEGGITSHAAVIAREFDIPCIVGAKNATKVLKDGDKVEVDANKGTVKIIKT